MPSAAATALSLSVVFFVFVFFVLIANPLRQESIKSVPFLNYFFFFLVHFKEAERESMRCLVFVTRLVWAGMTQVNR